MIQLKHIFTALALITLFIISSAPSKAAENNTQNEIKKQSNVVTKTHEETPPDLNEKAVFAFFQINNTQPNYERWIKGTKLYKQTVFVNRKPLIESETKRLSKFFNANNFREAPLTINQDIRLRVSANNKGGKTLSYKFADFEKTDIQYYPIKFGDEHIALIMQGLENLQSVDISRETFENSLKNHFFQDALYDAKVKIDIMPLAADHGSTMTLDGKERWLMMGEITNLQILYYDRYNRENVVIWDYEVAK